ncbi:MAG: 1-acyl-sn-glycerol-3-phosphate acyltransferase [Phycisphaeraceae bacterium]|nr:MAG: 1-acyl-sn-glycerol-3-phosphate acyltransferase [Phycisphaeraceae bacterium]
MTATIWVILATALWMGVARVASAALKNPRQDPAYGIGYLALRAYVRVIQRFRVIDPHLLPAGEKAGPLVVVVNHSAGIDPVLVQCACPFEVRWLMARDMMLPRFDRLWAWLRVIPIDRSAGDAAGLREALRHLSAGGVIGLFPEGRIARPRGTIQPFAPGVGLLVKRSGAPVLPIVIEGTADAESAWASLFTPARATLRPLPVRSYAGRDLSAHEIADDLRRVFAQATGWVPVEDPVARAAGPGGAVRGDRPRRAGGPSAESAA